MSEKRLVLLGDSILDNAPYTRPEPDTTEHLQERLGAGWSVELLARNGAMMASVDTQLRQLDETPDVAVLSIGGNDALGQVGLLERPDMSAGELLNELLSFTDRFAEEYEEVARAVADRAERTLLCTIYEVPLEPPRLKRLARAPLGMLNDQIIRIGSRLGVGVVELRTVCTDPADFTQEIEPSAQGAARIAEAIADVVGMNDSVRSGPIYSWGLGQRP